MLTDCAVVTINRALVAFFLWQETDKTRSRVALNKCGGVGEWLIPPDCKSGALGYTGSNPVPSTIHATLVDRTGCGYSTMVVQQPSKLNMRVRFSLPAPLIPFQRKNWSVRRWFFALNLVAISVGLSDWAGTSDR